MTLVAGEAQLKRRATAYFSHSASEWDTRGLGGPRRNTAPVSGSSGPRAPAILIPQVVDPTLSFTSAEQLFGMILSPRQQLPKEGSFFSVAQSHRAGSFCATPQDDSPSLSSDNHPAAGKGTRPSTISSPPTLPGALQPTAPLKTLVPPLTDLGEPVIVGAADTPMTAMQKFSFGLAGSPTASTPSVMSPGVVLSPDCATLPQWAPGPAASPSAVTPPARGFPAEKLRRVSILEPLPSPDPS